MKRLAGKRIATDADVTQAVTFCLHSFDNDIFYDGIQTLVRRGWWWWCGADAEMSSLLAWVSGVYHLL
jgi:hypothetical protein